uniref:Replication factor C clamp loader n=1 Tax=Clandestinovirus TaxID=2831644 RepID=A0A8F8PKK3_9VIRU|nr:replication factor C clamp loader [Clandestinovirus]
MDQWINKHHPTSLSECLVGGKGNKEKIIGWMNQRSRKTGLPCLMISGQSGSGKSTLIDMIGKQPNVVMSKNYASDERTSEKMSKMLNDLIFRPVFRVVPKDEYKIFVIDEADSSTDGPLLTWVANNVEKYSRECSFIVVANDPSSKPIRTFLTKMNPPESAHKLLHIKLEPFTDDVIIGVLKNLLNKEQKPQMEVTPFMEIVQGSNGDLRRAINELQWWYTAHGKNIKSSTPINLSMTGSPNGFDKAMEVYDETEKETPGFTKLMSTQSVFTFMQQSRSLMYETDKEDRVKMAFALGEYDKFFMPLMMGTNAIQMVTTDNIENSVYATTTQKKQGRFGANKLSQSDIKKKELSAINFCLDLCDSFCQYDVISADIHQNHGDNWEMEEYGLASGFARPLLLLSLGKKPISTWQPPILMPTKHHFSTNIQPVEAEVDANWRVEMETSVPKTSWCLDFKPMLRTIYSCSLSTIYEGKDSEMKLKQMQVFVHETKTTPERFSALDDLKFVGGDSLSMSSKALRKVFDNIMSSYKQEHRFAKKVDVNPQKKTLQSLGLDDTADDKPKRTRATKPKTATGTVRSRGSKAKACLLDDTDAPVPIPVVKSPASKPPPQPRTVKKVNTLSPIKQEQSSPESMEISPIETSPSEEQLPSPPMDTHPSPVAPKQTSRFSTKRSAPPPSTPEPPQKKPKLGSLAKGQCKISSFFGKSKENEPKSEGQSNKPSISGPKKMGLKNLLSAFDNLEGKVVHRQ